MFGRHSGERTRPERAGAKAYLLKESLDRLWDYRYEGAMLRYLQSWITAVRLKIEQNQLLATLA